MGLFSNRSQMTSKCGKNENVALEAIAECVTDVLTIFCFLFLNRRTATWNLFVLYNNKKKNYYSESRPLPTLVNTKKKGICRNLLAVQNEAISLVARQSKELRLVRENHPTVKLDSSVALRGRKLTVNLSRLN